MTDENKQALDEEDIALRAELLAAKCEIVKLKAELQPKPSDDKKLIELLEMKYCEPRLFRLLAEKFHDHYEKFAGKMPYPDDNVLDIIVSLDNVAYFFETCDEQHAEDMKNDYQEKE